MCYVYLIHKHLETVKSFLYISVQWSRWNHFCKPVLLTVEREFAFVYNDVLRRNRVQVFSSPLENLSLCNRKHEKDQKPRVNPIQPFFPFEAFGGGGGGWGGGGKTSSVTAPTVTWPTLRKQSIVQAKEVYSKRLLGINLVNSGQAWLKIAETSGYILSLFYVYDR